MVNYYQQVFNVSTVLFIGALMLMSPSAIAGKEAFKSGATIKEYGKIAPVTSSLVIPKGMVFKVAFDMSKAAKPSEVNRSLNTLARFINMHVEADVKPQDIQLAMVVHGSSITDLANDAFYQQVHGKDVSEGNPNKELVQQLINHGVKIYICGQSAAYYGLEHTALLPGVDMALSAMTAHAVLAQEGYSLNPF
ncbi:MULTISPECIES: DsrE family protein [Shewanella]|uniref:DsrE family protein n=1 Tax=Shewanella TaxID=22 RepID=UPI0006D6851F|nr:MULTISPECIES: DsrE family protein [Shewanella]KPZ71095.1 DsrE/DsrF-like family protein [Shewanella sp. P1-14-1]